MMSQPRRDPLPPEQWTTVVHRAPLLSLSDKVAPAHTALIVVDVLNDFCAEGGMMGEEGLDLSDVQAMAQRLPALLDAARAAGVFVVFVRNEYNTEQNWYLSDVWLEMAARRRDGRSYTVRPACAPDSWNNDFYGPVQPLDSEPVIVKHRYNAFHGTALELVLRTRGIRTVLLTGVASNVCVETTAREAFMRDYYVVFSADGTATYSPEEHAAALRTIDRYFGEVAPIADVIDCWA